MKIRRIEMAGFKSFADRTTLIFSEGLSGVVGSNGCGKSNVVDAVRWCLGEQSAKSMRGSAMQDIIFSGTQQRKAVGRAEVSIVFTPGEKPFKGDYALHDEIQITRRIEREGPSQYFINQQRVRLKDVQDIFLDSGLSNQRYSFIEQGQIGNIVNARPSETRQLIEEAAGISRYQQRRSGALDRLRDVDGNLSQLKRMIQDHDRRLRTVEKQVRTAWMYRCFESRISQLTRLIELTQYGHLVALRREQSRVFREAEQEEARISRKLDQQVSILFEARNAESLLQTKVNELRAQLGELESERRENLAQIASSKQEKINISALQDERTIRIEQLYVSLSENREERRKVNSQHKAAIVELSAYQARFKQAAQVHNESTTRIREIDTQRQQLTADEQNNARRIQVQSGLIQSAQITNQQLSLESDKLTSESLDIQGDIEEAEKVYQSHTVSHEDAGLRLLSHELAKEKTTTECAGLDAQRTAEKEHLLLVESNLRQITRTVSSLNGELDGLLRLHKRYEGISVDAKALLEHPSAMGVLAEFLEIKAEQEEWVSLLLSDYLDAVLCQSIEQSKDLLELSGGHVRVIVLEQSEACTHPKLCQLAKGPSGARALNAILPNYDEVDTIEEVGTETAWVSSISALVRRGSIVSVGESTAPALEFVSRSRALEQLRASLSEAEKSQYSADETVRDQRAKILKLNAQLQDSQSRMQGTEANIRRIRSEQSEYLRLAEQAKIDIQRKNQQFSRSKTRMLHIQEECDAALRSKASAEHERELINAQQQRNRKQQEELSSLRTAELSVAAQRSRARNNLNEQVNKQDKQLLALAQSLQFLDTTHQAQQRSLDEQESDQHRQSQRLKDLQVQILDAKEKVESIVKAQQTHQVQYEAEDEHLVELRTRIKTLDDQNSAIQNEKEKASQERLRIEIQLESTRESIQKSRDLLAEQYDLNAPVALEQIDRNGFVALTADVRLQDEKCPEDLRGYSQTLRVNKGLLESLEMQEDRRQELSGIQKELGGLGDVNHTALEAHQELEEERHRFQQQYDDLSASAKRIRETIEKLNFECVTRFGETFAAVNAAFQEIYPRLVGGGRAELELCEPSELLTTGVELYAQPPGKRLQSLKPLSGGEKAMVAISFLFSLFRVKPSPFCLLDEVDAPLDEGNGARFNAMLVEMSAQSQFIVITHNKKTMEVMDTLYGVSMPTQGISQIVSVELS